ncbi:hypothetical protein B0H13DRAFT_2266874 [Mycena leptocephala]|nr:hypothetical protein B0H13DRAFT_2266874 [Mycena leptocephala]
MNLKISKLKPSSLKTPQAQKPFKVSLEQVSMTKPFKAKPSSFKPLLYPVNVRCEMLYLRHPISATRNSQVAKLVFSDVPTTLTVAQKRAPVSTSNDWRSVTVSRYFRFSDFVVWDGYNLSSRSWLYPMLPRSSLLKILVVLGIFPKTRVFPEKNVKDAKDEIAVLLMKLDWDKNRAG